MKKLSIVLFAGVLTVISLPAAAQNIPLFAGQHTEVGNLYMSCDGETLGANYNLGVGWCLVETHFYAGNDEPKKGAPGQFPFKHEDLSTTTCATTDPYTINLAEAGIFTGSDDEIFAAAHAVVCEALGQTPDWVEYVNAIDWAAGDDGLVTISVKHPGTDSYFETTISNGGTLNGTYDGYCIDTDLQISSNQPYDAIPVPAFVVDDDGNPTVNPEVMGLVNDWTRFGEVAWLINQDFVNDGFHYCDVQTAIWTLLGESITACSGRNSDRVDQLVAMAMDSGWEFVPGCNELVPVILVPVDGTNTNNRQITIAQITFAEIDVPCRAILGDCETAWAIADNGQLWGKGGGWGEYFQYYGCQ